MVEEKEHDCQEKALREQINELQMINQELRVKNRALQVKQNFNEDNQILVEKLEKELRALQERDLEKSTD